MRERGGNRAGWMGKWDEGERRGKGWMNVGDGCKREEGAGLDGWGISMREREGSQAA